jgi:hypothetical protein
MKVIGYTALRYGADYLGWAIRSVIDHIDEYHVLYATRPSHGHYSDAVCPDSEDELHDIAWQAAGLKLKWHRGDWTYEGQQRDSILQYAPDADVILSVDSDEIYSEKLINNIMRYAGSVQYSQPFRYLRVPFIHYWRSFHRCILHDPAYPARVTFPRIPSGESSWYPSSGVVNHMGYATRPDIVAYKWQIHGHLGELRRDVNWFNDVFMNKNRSTDLHPVGSTFWNYEQVNPLDYMPAWMSEHPFYGMDVIT